MAVDALVAEWFISLTFLSFSLLLSHCLLSRDPVSHSPTKMQGFGVLRGFLFACLVGCCWVFCYSLHEDGMAEWGRSLARSLLALAGHEKLQVKLPPGRSLKLRALAVFSWKSRSNCSGRKVSGTFQWKMFWQDKKITVLALMGSAAFSVYHPSFLLRFWSLSLSCILKFLKLCYLSP